jgi:membrane protease YdiL (CAAX protease family)
MLFELSTSKLIALGLLMLFAATLPSAIAVALMPDYQLGGPDFSKQSPLRTIFLGCVIAPLLETLINQWACLRLLEKLRVNASVAILISSFVFAVLHYYSFAYMMTAFFSGVVLSTVFTIERCRRGHPFLATFATHAMKNWIASAFLLLT